MTIFDDIKHAGESAVDKGEKGFNALTGLGGHLSHDVKEKLEELARKVHRLERQIQFDAIRAERIAKGFARHVQDDFELADQVAHKLGEEGKAIADLTESIAGLAGRLPSELLSTAEQYERAIEPMLSTMLSPEAIEHLFQATLPTNPAPASDPRGHLKTALASLVEHINELAQAAETQLPLNINWLQQTIETALDALPDESVGRAAALIGNHLDSTLSQLASLRPSGGKPVPGALTAAKGTSSDKKVTDDYKIAIGVRQGCVGLAALLDGLKAAFPVRIGASAAVQLTVVSVGGLLFGGLSLVCRLVVVVIDTLIATDVV